MIPKEILRAVAGAAERRWVGLQVDAAAVAAILLARIPEGADPGDAAWLDALETPDLVLAGAALDGDKAALAILERFTGRIAEEVLARHAGAGIESGELRQRLLHLLLVSDGGPAGLRQYAGRGSLDSFIRVTAVRAALREARARGRFVPLDAESPAAATAPLPVDLEQLRQRYRAPFEQGLREALRALEPRERNLLRLYYLERLPCERIALLYGVHTSTAWRWIGRTTARLHEDVARRLMEMTGASPSEVESILRVVATQLEGSLGGALESTR